MTVFPNDHCKVCACLFLFAIFNIGCCSASTIDVFSANKINFAGLSRADSSLQRTIFGVGAPFITANAINPSNSDDSVARIIAVNNEDSQSSFFSGKDLTEMTVSILGHQVAATIPIPASFWLLGFSLIGLSVFINRGDEL
jgi:hypothetical protein